QVLELTRRLDANLSNLDYQPLELESIKSQDGVLLCFKVKRKSTPLLLEESDLNAAPLVQREGPRRVLVIAAVPNDARQASALWTELECLTRMVDKVIVSAPGEHERFVLYLLDLARKHIPHFANEQVLLEAKFYSNDRYDVGLWCDALEDVNKTTYDEFGLLNDSVFVIKPDSQVLDAIEGRNLSLSSLAYSFSSKFFREFGPEHYSVQSTYRGMYVEGLHTFMSHSCHPVDHPSFCADDPSEARRKACIANNFERTLASKYDRDKVGGLYLADAPKDLSTEQNGKIWQTNVAYWKKLVAQHGFPVIKSKRTNIIPEVEVGNVLEHPLLEKCSRYANTDLRRLLQRTF
ncbi:MAG: hypothetical protein SGILL_009240, partial [Bacillariaceae sp.]